MNPNNWTASAERAGQRYALFLGSLTSFYQEAIKHPQPGSAHVKNMVVKRAYIMAKMFLDNETPQIEALIEQQRNDAITYVQDDLEVEDESALAGAHQDHTQEITVDLENAVRVQIERDIGTLTRAIRNLALRAQISAKARDISLRDALTQLQQENTAPSFTYQDRIGKHWQSEKFVRTIYRQSMVYAWNETAMLEMVEWGATHAIIDHTDQSHSERGTIVALTDEASSETAIYETLRDDVFHPNTNAWLRPFATSN